MKIDQVVTLANNTNYLLLLESENTEDKYFLSVLLDEMKEPTQNYAVLKEIVKNGKIYCQKINNPIVLNQLLEDYQLQYNDMYNDSDN